MSSARVPLASHFPPRPRSFKARGRELATLAAAVRDPETPRIALIGAGGSGKSTLAMALGHRVRESFPGGIHWFRVGAWNMLTLTGMLALHFGVPLAHPRRLAAVRAQLASRDRTFVVLDNHENDAAVAELLNALRDLPVTWMITARRCLLAGVSVFPVVPPLITERRSPFPAVASLTRLLRWNPVALDLADAIVASGESSAAALGRWLEEKGAGRVRVIAHEDDLPEIGLLVAWIWPRLPPASRRMLAVLAHTGGDHVDRASLAALARAGRDPSAALAPLLAFRLLQEPLAGRFALHATVRHALASRTTADPGAEFEHYVSLLERHPERFEEEQTHLFAAMDQAHEVGGIDGAVRMEQLVARLERGREG